MKIFLDSFFYQLCPGPSNIFYDPLVVPEDCDLVGISFYDNDLDTAVSTLDRLISRTKKLLVNLSEPTNVAFVLSLMKRYRNTNVFLFSDIVCNFSPPQNFATTVSWFIHSENFYATRSWAQDRLQKITHGFKPKKFDCLLGSEKPHRTLIETFCLNSQFRDEIILTYYKDQKNNGLWDWDVDNYFIGQDPNCKSAQVARDTFLPLDIYNQTYYSVVAETTAFNEYNQYTEKVAKPMLACRPFVVFSGQNYLRNLRSLGFKTFDTVIDESYDTEYNTNKRLQQAWQQVELLCKLDPTQVRNELQSVLQHNQQHFLQNDWHSAIKQHF